jgi:integrase
MLFQVKTGTHTPESASITVAEAAEDWIKRAELEERERATIAQYRQHVDLHIVPLIGNVKLAKLTAPGMREVRDKLLEFLSRSMAKKVLGSIKSVLKDAQSRGNVSQNVAQGVSIKMEKRHKRKIEVGVDLPTKDEARNILATVEGRWRPLLVTAIFTGLRASELRGLSWDAVDFRKKEVHVRQRADRYNQTGSPKSHAGERRLQRHHLAAIGFYQIRAQAHDLGVRGPGRRATVSRTRVTRGARGDMLRASIGPARPGDCLRFLGGPRHAGYAFRLRP